MLQLLHIENIAVIERADISFRAGFNALTGETGAGKSIVIDSLGAVLGARTSRDLIRTGAAKAFVSAEFDGVDASLPVLAALGVDPEDGVLLLTAQADIAILEGAISGLQTLQSRGIDTITFTNGTISVSFSLAEVIAKGVSSDVYRLTLSGGEASFTLADADITALLGK